MSSSSRWNRLMSPHGVFQVPKSRGSLSEAATSACQKLVGGRLFDGCASPPTPAAAAPPPR
jgi:hypothetical protein